MVSAIDAGAGNGKMLIYSNSTVISTMTLTKPSATVSGGVLTFSGTPTDASAVGGSSATEARITDSAGTLIISGLTVGIPGSVADVILSNGVNSLFITAGQAVTLIAGQIQGS